VKQFGAGAEGRAQPPFETFSEIEEKPRPALRAPVKSTVDRH